MRLQVSWQSVSKVISLGLVLFASNGALAQPTVAVPELDGPWWHVAGNPDLGDLSTPEQEPVDFGLWQASDGTWQIWSCIRKTAEKGHKRLFHGWEGKSLTDTDWKPTGIQQRAMTELGEDRGGMQAPHVVKHDGLFYMYYGDWQHICLATSTDGKSFARQLNSAGKPAVFDEGKLSHSRDAMLYRDGTRWLAYYTANPNDQGAIYCRESSDLKTWSESNTAAFGGRMGTEKYDAECPHVVKHNDVYYLFRTKKYGKGARTAVYCSKDPKDFGINQDRLHYVCELPIAAPELVMNYNGQDYLAALTPELDGIQIAKLRWVTPTEESAK